MKVYKALLQQKLDIADMFKEVARKVCELKMKTVIKNRD